MKLQEFLKKTVSSKRLKKIIRVLNGPQVVCNINLRTTSQKRILLCYLPQCFEPISNHVGHPNILHCISMVSILIKKGYIIDVCYSNDLSAIGSLSCNRYDYIIGFGEVFDEFLKSKDSKKILIVTENDPNVVKEKYEERIKYYKERHPQWRIDRFITRNSFYKADTFNKLDTAIIMNSEFNINSFKHHFPFAYPINVNGLYNKAFDLDKKKKSSNVIKFLWFGSSGLLHKGLDIIIDAFAEMPDLELDVYGANPKELKSLKDIPANVFLRGKINVFSEEFLQMAYEHAFVISDSCSEGMNSGIATCMLHGIIPIVTRETGFNSHSSIIELKGYKVEDIKETLMHVSMTTSIELQRKINEVFEYAHDNFTLEKFEQNFERIVDTILN